MSSFASSRRLALVLALGASLAACGGGGGGSNSNSSANTDVYGWSAVTALKTTDTTMGTGASADAGKSVSVNYSGYIYDVRVTDTKGTKFDSGTFPFTLGSGTVIPGFDQGVTGMKVGGKRTVTIPANLAYGSAGKGTIPANAALVFDIELVSVN